MSKGYSQSIPAVSAKFWAICDGCGVESTPTDDNFAWELCPLSWAAFTSSNREPLHFCEECIPTISVRGHKLYAEAIDILGEEYFK